MAREDEAQHIGEQISLVVRRLLMRTLRKILGWVAGLFGGCLPFLAVACAGLVVIGLIVGYIADTALRHDTAVRESWPDSLQERAERAAKASVHRPDEEPYAVSVQLLAAIRMAVPDLKTDDYDVEQMAGFLRPIITRQVYPTETVTTVTRLVCEEGTGQCTEEITTTTSFGTQNLIQTVVAWDGVHELTYRRVTETETRVNDSHERVTVKRVYWVEDNHTFRQDYTKLKTALVMHDPPLGSHDDPEALDDRVNWIVWLLNSGADPFTDTASSVVVPTDLYAGHVLDGDWLWPLSGQPQVTSLFGDRISPVDGVRRFHGGVDMISSDLTIRAVAAGVVVESTNDNIYGQRLVVDHGNGVKTVYCHLQKKYVSKGQVVKQGEPLGLMGETGKATGVHLHFEVYVMDSLADPLAYMFPDVSWACISCTS